VIAFGLLPLANLIIFYCLLTKEDEDMWDTDPNQYISAHEDKEGYDYSIRDISLRTFSNIIEKYKNDAVQIIMVIIDSLIFHNDKSDVKKIYNNMITSGNFFCFLRDSAGLCAEKFEGVRFLEFDEPKFIGLFPGRRKV
jgi:hypothetical protein